LEEKGIHKEKPDEASLTPAESTGSDSADKAGKPGKMDRLKEKLHLNKGH
jgi:hypothetical protein